MGFELFQLSDLKASLEYIEWSPLYEVEKPFQVFVDIPRDCPDQRKHNLTFNTVTEETIYDIRGTESQYTLDGSGFAYIKHASKLQGSQFYEMKTVDEIYVPECEEVLKTQLNDVKKVHIYSWRLRHSNTAKQSGQVIDFNDQSLALGPAKNPHVNTSAASVIDMVNLYLPNDAKELLRGLVRVVNGPVQTWPLAVANGSTVSDSSFIETHRIRRAFASCTLFSKHQPGVKWCNLSQQMPDDLLLFKKFDSKHGVAKYAAHVAVPPQDFPNAKFVRESIEVRALVSETAAVYEWKQDGERLYERRNFEYSKFFAA